MSAAIKSIEIVSNLVESDKLKLLTKNEESISNVERDIKLFLHSVLYVSRSLERFLELAPPPAPKYDPTVILSGCIKNLSSKVAETRKTISYVPKTKKNLLHFLTKDESENFHSDFISALLDTRKSGNLSKEFFAEIVNFVTGETVHHSDVRSRREISLGEMVEYHKGKELGSRRIDILARNTTHLLVIENKVNSFESDSQTEDYHRVTLEYNKNLLHKKKVVEILLSPQGITPQCSSYFSMSYHDLFEILWRLRNAHLNESCIPFLDMYLDSLFENYYSKEISYIHYLQDYWRNK